MGPPAEKISGYGGKKTEWSRGTGQKKEIEGETRTLEDVQTLHSASKATELSWAMTEYRALGLIP